MSCSRRTSTAAACTTMRARTAICGPGRVATHFISPVIAAFPGPVPVMLELPTAGRVSLATAACDGVFAEALDGNCPLIGELAADEGVLALAFADSPEGARTLAHSSLYVGFDAVRRSALGQWRAWGKDLVIPDAPEEVRREPSFPRWF